MLRAPTYALYGEERLRLEPDFLHCETIPERSRLHHFRIEPHRHEQLFQILLLSSGEAEVEIEGTATVLRPPSVVFVPAMVVHGYRFSNLVDGWVVTAFQRRVETILRASPEAARGLTGARVVPLARPSEPAAAIAALAVEFAGGAIGRLAMLEAHLAILCVAALRARHAPAANGLRPPSQGLAGVARFREMVERDFQTGRSIEDYARRLGMTPTHLRRLCRAHLGATPLAVLNARVVLEAKRQLVFSAREVKEIAGLVGFDDAAYFSRFFQRETGFSPTAFRARPRTTEPLPAAPSPNCADMPPETDPQGA